MDKTEYEARIRELENQFKVMEERYQILVETTDALLFEYRPDEDKMIFTYNFADNKSRKVIENYHAYVKATPLVHPDHLKKFMSVLTKAASMPVQGELDYLSKVSTGEFQWHRTYYSSIADKQGKIIRVIGRIHNIHESETERQNMIHRVETDFLTGLYNKEAAMSKISHWMKQNSTREAHMIMLDLDDFKNINDIYGHTFGDEILKSTAQILLTCFDEHAILSRFGGDEFVIFVKEDSVRVVESRIDKVMQKMEQEGKRLSLSLSCSAGISARMSKYDDFEDMFNRADNAMYQAKKRGKDRYFIYKE